MKALFVPLFFDATEQFLFAVLSTAKRKHIDLSVLSVSAVNSVLFKYAYS
jgi:hypothetical protein